MYSSTVHTTCTCMSDIFDLNTVQGYIHTCPGCLVFCKFKQPQLLENEARSNEKTGTDSQRQTDVKIPDLFFGGCERHRLIGHVCDVRCIVHSNLVSYIL